MRISDDGGTEEPLDLRFNNNAGWRVDAPLVSMLVHELH